MKTIQLIEKFDLERKISAEKDIQLRQLYDGARRRIIEIKLVNGKVLSKHKAVEPITIMCLAGKGKLMAGVDLQDQEELVPGTLVTIESEIEHEVIAEPELLLVLTKFKEH